jgi:hypothetical protein
MPDVLNETPASVRIAGRTYIPSPADKGVAVLLTATSWVLQRLPGQVVEGQRRELIRALSTETLTVEVQCRPPAVRVLGDGRRLLVELSPNGG